MSSVSCVWTCETWNYVEYPSPLVYSKFYSSDINLIMVWQIKSQKFQFQTREGDTVRSRRV